VPDDGSISVWLDRLKGGDPKATEALWQRFYRHLVEQARQRLRGLPSRSADEEDVALSAFDSFFRGVQAGRFPRLDDRHDLWQVLLMLLANKAASLRRYERRHKRGGGRVVPASALEGALGEVRDDAPSPQLAAQVAEECRRLLDLLGDEELRATALAKLEGYSNEEIAARLGRSLATVERRLRLIRESWEGEVTP
jgi:DNA-directed RNA polymerase specialized sigma24 family protein